MELSSEMQEKREAKEEIKADSPHQTKKELFAELDKLRNEINHSRSELNRIDSGKELWFKKKNALSGEIAKNIGLIRENRKKRDSLTKDVKELKEKRDAFNREIRQKISGLAALKEELRGLTKKSRVKDPYMIKGEIDRIEVKLETEAMPFEKEKELSKRLKLLKKMLAEAGAAVIVLDKIKKLNYEIALARENSDAAHAEIQKLAQESQKLHESIIAASKETDSLKISEEDAFKNFSCLKKKFNEANASLKEKLGALGRIRADINKFRLEEDEKRRLEEDMLVKSKEHEIEEKIKTGKKLTTEDFLMFQEAVKGKKAD